MRVAVLAAVQYWRLRDTRAVLLHVTRVTVAVVAVRVAVLAAVERGLLGDDAGAVLFGVALVAVAVVTMEVSVTTTFLDGLLGDDTGEAVRDIALVAVAVVTMEVSVTATFLDGLLGDDTGEAVRDIALVAVAVVAVEVSISSTLDFVGVGIRSAACGEENRRRGQEGQSKRSRMHHGSRHMGEMARSLQAASARLAISHV
ncbi:hypothetical protein HK404_18040 [Myxococcus xanthus]|nr:hypothetical protein [Myxococcus xanthus]